MTGEENNIAFSDAALRKIIREYTREAGVRGLERQIASICRKIARQAVKNRDISINITVSSINKYLGVEKYRTKQVAEWIFK